MYKTINGGKVNWRYWRSRLGPTDAKRAADDLRDAEKVTNVLTLIQKRERKIPREGLQWRYERLCKIAHPSRGSREILYAGPLRAEGREVGRRFSLAPPSEAAYLDRVRDVVVPVVQETALVLHRHVDVFTPLINRLGRWTRTALTARGYDVGELLMEDKSLVRANIPDDTDQN